MTAPRRTPQLTACRAEGEYDATTPTRLDGGHAVALIAGVCAAVQLEVNAVLGARLGSTLVASLVNFAVAFVVVAVALSLRPDTRHRLADLWRWDVPRWTLTAGFAGAIAVSAGVVTVETIGVAVFSVAFFAGQIISGLLVDRLGVAPGGRRPVTTARLQAMVLALLAIGITQLGQRANAFEPSFVAFAAASGGGIALQSAFNARIASYTGDPVAATAVNVTVGAAALAILVAALGLGGAVDPPHWPSQPWLYLGGVLGVTIVFFLAVATAGQGVLRATLTMLAAQIIAAFGVDWVVQGDPPTVGVIAGAFLIVGAVALVGRRDVHRRTPRPADDAEWGSETMIR